MLELHDNAAVPAAESLNRFSTATGGAKHPPRPRLYGGPERRGAASRQHHRMAQMLDALDHAMLLVDADGRVEQLNKAARHELDESHPLQLDGDQLNTRFAHDTQPLRNAMANAAQRGLRRLLQLGEGRNRVSVAVVPLPPVNDDEGHGVALLLGRRQVCEELTVDWFARSHGLTFTETTVIKGLCADLTPQQIAERQGVGLATIRTQIGSIRLKTGACSIRALLRQVALLPPLVSALHGNCVAMAAGSANGAAERPMLLS